MQTNIKKEYSSSKKCSLISKNKKTLPELHSNQALRAFLTEHFSRECRFRTKKTSSGCSKKVGPSFPDGCECTNVGESGEGEGDVTDAGTLFEDGSG